MNWKTKEKDRITGKMEICRKRKQKSGRKLDAKNGRIRKSASKWDTKNVRRRKCGRNVIRIMEEEENVEEME